MQISGTQNQPLSPTEPQVPVTPATEPVQTTASAEPKVAEPTVPVQTVADDADFMNLLLGLEDEPSAPAGQPTPVQPQQPARLTMEDVMSDPAKFESYLQQRDQDLFQAATQHALQQMIPVASQMVVKALAYQNAAEKFWNDEKNQVLVPYAQTFGKLVDQAAKKDPTLSPVDLYNKAGKVLHAAVARMGNQPAAAPNPLPVPPSGTNRPNGVPQIDPAKAKLRQIFRWNDLPNK